MKSVSSFGSFTSGFTSGFEDRGGPGVALVGPGLVVDDDHGKTMGKPWENHGKTMGKMEVYPLVNVDSLRTGQITSLKFGMSTVIFGHFQERTVSLPKGSWRILGIRIIQ